MQRRHDRIVSILSLVAITSLCTYATQQNEVPGETMARMAELGEKLAMTNEHHRFLEKLSGTWTTTSSIFGMPTEDGTSSNAMIFGNRFLEGSYGGTFMGVEYTGRMIIGYDNYKNKFVAMYIDTLGTSMRTAEGMLDQSKTTLSLWGTMDEWITDEHDKPVMYRYTIIDGEQFTLDIHDLGISPGETKVIKITFNRSTK